MKQRISKRLIGYFTGTLLLFAVVIGAVFAVLFTQTMNSITVTICKNGRK